MMSLVAKRFDDAKAGRTVRLFKSHRDGIGDGEQRRDFIYVDDAVAVVRWLMQTPSGVGHLQCRHRQGAKLPRPDHGAVPRARARRPRSNMSTCRRTSAASTSISRRPSVENLLRAGYNAGFTSLEDGVRRYVTQFLDTADRYR